MDRRAAISVLIGALVAVLFAAVATSGAVELVDGPPTFTQAPAEPPPVITVEPEKTEEFDETERESFELPHFVEVIMRVVFYVVLAIAAVLASIFAWRHRPSLRWRRRRRRSTDFEVLDDVVASIAADADAQRAALAHGSPRNAIVECWLRLEATVSAAGVRRDPADTSTELTRRVLAAADVDPFAIDRLAALYREARFSTHVMDERSRQAAVEALDEVHEGLRSGIGATVVSR